MYNILHFFLWGKSIIESDSKIPLAKIMQKYLK